MLSIAVIDDEPKARETILNILALSQNKLMVTGEADSVKTGFELISAKAPDVVLLDINLPDGTGFDLLKKFQTFNFKIIFITAHEEYAIKAFKYSAIDYIMKPIVAGELLGAVEKAKERMVKEDTALKIGALMSNLEKLKKIVLKTSESIHIVNVKDIIRCEADVNYTRFHLSDKKSLLVSRPLKEYDSLLEHNGFLRSHQSHLVNLEHIIRFDKSHGGYLVMDDQSTVPVSMRKRDDLFRLFDQM